MKDKTKFADTILERIKNEDIQPKSRLGFLIKNYFMWFLGLLAVLVGGIAAASIIFSIKNGDWALYLLLSDSLMIHVIKVMPFLWITLLGLFIVVAIYQMKHTKRGYKYPIALLLAGNIILSTVIGYGLYSFGYAHSIDNRMGTALSSYKGVEGQRKSMWTQPDTGLLAGYVLGTTSDKGFVLRDYRGDDWDIATYRFRETDWIILEMVSEVGLVGNRIGTSTFEACAVRPWDMRGANSELREQMRKQMVERGVGTEDVIRDILPSIKKTKNLGSFNIQGRDKNERVEKASLSDFRDMACDRGNPTTSPEGVF